MMGNQRTVFDGLSSVFDELPLFAEANANLRISFRDLRLEVLTVQQPNLLRSEPVWLPRLAS